MMGLKKMRFKAHILHGFSYYNGIFYRATQKKHDWCASSNNVDPTFFYRIDLFSAYNTQSYKIPLFHHSMRLIKRMAAKAL